VLTVHDVSFLHHPEWFNARDLVVLNAGVRASAPRAARVLVPSRYVRHELCELLGLDPRRVVVTPEGVDPRFQPPSTEPSPVTERLFRRLGIRRPYVFALGNLQPRKNLTRLVEAWARLTGAGAVPEYRLVVGGGFRGRRDGAAALSVALGIGDRIVFPGYVPEDELPVLYGSADLFVHPSLHEGFGLTALEAMACGTPVACSDAAALPEVTDGAAALFDPEDAGGMAAVLGALLADPALRADLRERGLRRAARAGWRTCAESTAAAYEAAAATRSHPSS
jgi:glycosyltransferase involved in cell wall biosynthesis